MTTMPTVPSTHSTDGILTSDEAPPVHPEATPSMRRYLQAEEQAIEDAKRAYREALAALQAACEHRVVAKHTDSRYTDFRVCEDCGITCIAEWGSSVHAKGEKSLMAKRAYPATWTEFAQQTAAVKLRGQRW